MLHPTVAVITICKQNSELIKLKHRPCIINYYSHHGNRHRHRPNLNQPKIYNHIAATNHLQYRLTLSYPHTNTHTHTHTHKHTHSHPHTHIYIYYTNTHGIYVVGQPTQPPLQEHQLCLHFGNTLISKLRQFQTSAKPSMTPRLPPLLPLSLRKSTMTMQRRMQGAQAMSQPLLLARMQQLLTMLLFPSCPMLPPMALMRLTMPLVDS